jgi:hypothetical protein
MIAQELSPEAKGAPEDFGRIIDASVYGRGGLWVHAFAIDHWIKGAPLHAGEWETIITLGPVLEQSRATAENSTPSQKDLLTVTKIKYAALPRLLNRFILGGEENFVASDRHFEQGELIRRLGYARERGLVTSDGNFVGVDQGIDASLSTSNLMTQLSRRGVMVDVVEKSKEWNALKSSQAVRPKLLELAILKFGALFDNLEQVVFDAEKQGVPISGKHEPNDPPVAILDGHGWLENRYHIFYGKEENVFPLGNALYQIGDLFLKHANRRDPLLRHLFSPSCNS